MSLTSFVHLFVPGESLESPTLLLLHGTGGDERSLIELGTDLLPGANLLSPKGNVDEDGMARFFRRLSEGVFDLEDLRERTAELSRFAIEAQLKYEFEGPLYAVGYSNGANVAASLLLTVPGALDGAVLFRPMLPDEPSEKIELDAIPILLLSGEHDPLMPRASAERLAELLREGGADVTHRWQPAGHQLGMSDFVAAREFFSNLK